MRASKIFGIALLTLFCLFVQTSTMSAQNRFRTNNDKIKVSKSTIDVSKLMFCKPNGFYTSYVEHAKKSPDYNIMAVNVTLVSLWNHFTGQAYGQLKYSPNICSFVGTIDFRFSDRFYSFPNCNNSGGLNILPQYPFNPKHLDKADIRINVTTGLVSLQLWGNKSFDTQVTKGIINGFEKSANMMIAITPKKDAIPIIK